MLQQWRFPLSLHLFYLTNFWFLFDARPGLQKHLENCIQQSFATSHTCKRACEWLVSIFKDIPAKQIFLLETSHFENMPLKTKIILIAGICNV